MLQVSLGEERDATALARGTQAGACTVQRGTSQTKSGWSQDRFLFVPLCLSKGWSEVWEARAKKGLWAISFAHPFSRKLKHDDEATAGNSSRSLTSFSKQGIGMFLARI